MLRRCQFAFLLLPTLLTAQRVVLPHGTGAITPAEEWTALGAGELRLATRPSDPRREPAKRRLLDVVAELRRLERTDEHVLLHMPSATAGELRLVNAYAAAHAVTSAELGDDGAIARWREPLVRELTRPDAPVEFVDGTATDLFAVGGLRMRLRRSEADGERRIDVYLVPAGERLQYFECSFPASDAAAEAAITALLRTFDGAREPAGHTFPLILAGALGALAGILTALLRRRRQARRILERS